MIHFYTTIYKRICDEEVDLNVCVRVTVMLLQQLQKKKLISAGVLVRWVEYFALHTANQIQSVASQMTSLEIFCF